MMTSVPCEWREGTAVRIIRWVFIDTAIRFGHGSYNV